MIELWLLSEIWRPQKATRRRSYTDQLTGLPNRAALFHDLGERAAAVESSGHAPEIRRVALLDLTGLHDVNNSLGHAAGDEVLRSVARRLSVASEGITKAYRLSGVRFVLLVSGANDPLGLIADIRKVIGKLTEPIRGLWKVGLHQRRMSALYSKPRPAEALKSFWLTPILHSITPRQRDATDTLSSPPS